MLRGFNKRIVALEKAVPSNKGDHAAIDGLTLVVPTGVSPAVTFDALDLAVVGGSVRVPDSAPGLRMAAGVYAISYDARILSPGDATFLHTFMSGDGWLGVHGYASPVAGSLSSVLSATWTLGEQEQTGSNSGEEAVGFYARHDASDDLNVRFAILIQRLA